MSPLRVPPKAQPDPAPTSPFLAEVQARPWWFWLQTDLGLPTIHAIVYGRSGAWKSSFAASFPKPLLVLAFDPPDKSMPYKRLGRTQPCDDPYYSALGIRAYDVLKEEGLLLARIEEYAEPDPERPQAYPAFLRRAPSLSQEWGQWGTVVLDSLTFAEYAALQYEAKVMNANSRDPRQWYAGAKRHLDALLKSRLPHLPTNVCVVAHTGGAAEKEDFADGRLVGINAVGKLPAELPAGFGEVYHLRVDRDPDTGQLAHTLQTASDNIYHAQSQIHAPNPCPPDYAALWSVWAEEQPAR